MLLADSHIHHISVGKQVSCMSALKACCGMQTVDELRQRLPAPAQVHIGPQATLVMDVGRVQLQVGCT
jgi:hypothetical protein